MIRIATVMLLMLLMCLPNHVLGCMAEYRSTEQLFAASPLVVIGQVEDVVDSPDQDKTGNHPSRLGIDSDAHDPKPQIATVRVVEVLKGNCPVKSMRVNSGPLRSCAPFPVHYTFTKGDLSIFILPQMPEDDVVQMVWQGSKLPVSYRFKIENQIAHMKLFTDAYMAKLRLRTPGIDNKATELNKVLREILSRFDALPHDDYGNVETSKKQPFIDEAVNQLIGPSLDTIVAMYAIDTQQHAEKLMTTSSIWYEISQGLAMARGDEILNYEKTRINILLNLANVEQKFIDSYLATLKPKDVYLCFPPSTPATYRNLSPEDLTTDFILRFYSYERGDMYLSYVMINNELAKLDLQRTHGLITALYECDDHQLNMVGWWAARNIPGNTIVKLIINKLGSKPQCWRGMMLYDNKQENNRRLNALVNEALNGKDRDEQSSFWEAMRLGECFENIIVEQAVTCLEKEQKDPVNLDSDMSKVLQQYLHAAEANLAAQTSERSAQSFRKILLPKSE